MLRLFLTTNRRVFQLGRMGRPQLAHRKLAEANIEITNKMSAPPLPPPPHTRTHADTLEQKREKKHSSACLERVQVSGKKKDLCFKHLQRMSRKPPKKTFKTSLDTRVLSIPSHMKRTCSFYVNYKKKKNNLKKKCHLKIWQPLLIKSHNVSYPFIDFLPTYTDSDKIIQLINYFYCCVYF